MSEWIKIMSEKTNEELDEIVDEYKVTFSEVLEALSIELKKRSYRLDNLEDIEQEKNKRLKISNLVKKERFKKNVSFKWTPKYSDSINTKLPEKIALNSIATAMMSLWWDIVYFEDIIIEAKRKDKWGNYTEKITVTFKNQSIQIESKSLKNDFCDFGRNSKRVRELAFAFNVCENEYNDDSIKNELDEIKKREEKNKYQVPETLTKPSEQKKQIYGFLIGGAVLTSILIGGVLGFLASFIYVIFLYDFGIGLLTAISFGYLIKFSNISDFEKIKWIGFSSIVLTYGLSHLFRFWYIVNTNNIHDASLIDYIIAKVNNGLQYKDLNLGWIGLVIAWVVEIGIALLFYYLRVAQKVIVYDLENAPQDVVEFAIYLFNEGKEEDEVRIELAKKGWHEKEQQDLIFKAIGAEFSRQNFVRS